MPKKRPTNIILITTDTMRCDALSFMGSPFARTPNLDRLAAEGVAFTQAHSPAPVCMPARCTIMSGLHAPSHGCIENGINAFDDMPSFTKNLKELGYHNIMIGKTHFGKIPDSFDEVYEAKGEKSAANEDYFHFEMQKNGHSRKSGYLSMQDKDGHLDGYIADKLIECIGAADRDTPFFAFCSLLSPHTPLDPPQSFADYYSPDEMPPARVAPGEPGSLPPLVKEICGLPCENSAAGHPEAKIHKPSGNIAAYFSDEEIRRYKAAYYSLAAYCDHLVGKIIDSLDKSGLRQSTLVIFTSDHGQQYYDHGFNDKHNYFDESMRIPLIISQPGVLPSNVKDKYASLVDLAPTICAAAGGSFGPGHGFDLYTPLAQNGRSPRSCVPAAFYRSAALVTDEWKLAYYFDEDRAYLYNRIADPGENVNLGQDDTCSEVTQALLSELLKWHAGLINLEDTNRRSTDGGPVAQRVKAHLARLDGSGAEKTLNEKLKNKKYVRKV